MGENFEAVPAAITGFSAAVQAAGDAIVGAASADWEAAAAAAATALGPIGATYLAAHVPAQGNCVAKALEVGHLHHAIACATDGANASFVAADNA